jgi:hypothetical protein
LVAQGIGQRLDRLRVASCCSIGASAGLRFAAILAWLAACARRSLAGLAGCLWLLRQLLRGILRARQRWQRQWAAG